MRIIKRRKKNKHREGKQERIRRKKKKGKTSTKHSGDHLYSLWGYLTTSYSVTAALSLPLMTRNQEVLHNSARVF